MNAKHWTLIFASCIAGGLPAGVLAQTDSLAEMKMGDVTLYLSQKAWVANWETILVDSQIVPASSQNAAPLLQLSNRRVDISSTIPLTSFGVRLGAWSLSATVGWSTNFSDARVDGGRVSRSEYDINLGYAVLPNMTLALIHKGGRTDIRGTAGSPAAELFAARQDLKGWGLGASGTLPFTENLGGYGTVAYLKGKGSTGSDSVGTVHPKYLTAELGISYRIPGFLGGRVSVQGGYRRQSFRVDDQSLTTFALTPNPVAVSTRTESFTSTTKGLVVGATVLF